MQQELAGWCHKFERKITKQDICKSWQVPGQGRWGRQTEESQAFGCQQAPALQKMMQ